MGAILDIGTYSVSESLNLVRLLLSYYHTAWWKRKKWRRKVASFGHLQRGE